MGSPPGGPRPKIWRSTEIFWGNSFRCPDSGEGVPWGLKGSLALGDPIHHCVQESCKLHKTVFDLSSHFSAGCGCGWAGGGSVCVFHITVPSSAAGWPRVQSPLGMSPGSGTGQLLHPVVARIQKCTVVIERVAPREREHGPDKPAHCLPRFCIVSGVHEGPKERLSQKGSGSFFGLFRLASVCRCTSPRDSVVSSSPVRKSTHLKGACQ